ncbi:MAG TPA: DUF1616 domain-containing protein [Thermoplasmata archaeon]|nr:DUF1616 domain-containing protein [Thermoplasmata archaeon]
MVLDTIEAWTGFLFVFFLPGFALTRAVYPEQRAFRPLNLLIALQQSVLAVVLSVVLTILVGFLWLGTPTGVQAHWTSPLLEASLGGVTLVGFAAAALRGSFARVPPSASRGEDAPGESHPLELVRALDRLARDERRLRNRLRVLGAGSSEADEIERSLKRLRGEADRLRAEREAEYAA